MKQNTKGFTLIELLAVIVILAIIALIAVPVVMNIITNARKSASADSAYSVLDAAEKYYVSQLMMNPNEALTEIKFDFAGDTTALEIKGTKPTAGVITLDANGSAHIGEKQADNSYSGTLTINGFECKYKADGQTIECDTPQE